MITAHQSEASRSRLRLLGTVVFILTLTVGLSGANALHGSFDPNDPGTTQLISRPKPWPPSPGPTVVVARPKPYSPAPITATNRAS